MYSLNLLKIMQQTFHNKTPQSPDHLESVIGADAGNVHFCSKRCSMATLAWFIDFQSHNGDCDQNDFQFQSIQNCQPSLLSWPDFP